MNSYDFKSLRRHVNHDLLRNGFLYRLGAPETFFSAKDDHQREDALAAALAGVSDFSPKNLHVAVITWKGDGHQSEGIEALVIELHTRAKSLRHVRPTEEFPCDEQIRAWLQAISEYVGQAESLTDLTSEGRRSLALKASGALRELCDFIGALDVSSPRFWRLFVPDDQ